MQTVFRFGLLLAWLALGLPAAEAQSEWSFAAGVDSAGFARAQSNAQGQVLIESPQYPRGLWLHFADEAGQALAGLQIDYQSQPDSLIAVYCYDPAERVQATLIWSRPLGDAVRWTLKPRAASDDLPTGGVALDWQGLVAPDEELRLESWQEVAAFLQGRWQGQTGRVVLQFPNTSLTVALDKASALDWLPAHLQSLYAADAADDAQYLFLAVHDFKDALGLQEGIVFYTPLFPDPNLERVVRQALGYRHGLLTKETLASLTELNGRDEGIRNLQGIEHLTNLTQLDLGGNQLSDVTPLAGLTNLNWLSLYNNQLSDVAPLAELTNLTRLLLDNNQLSDVTPLAELTNLTYLSLWDNELSDVTPLADLTNLTHLSLSSNQLSDVAPLAELTNLTYLSLWDNELSDVTPLAELNNLTHLWLDNNQISDVTPIADLTNLTGLYLSGNQISDVAPLADLTNLTHLSLSSNQLSDVAPLADLNNLTRLLLGNNQISDVTPLADLTNLTQLYLSSNQISDVTPLADLTNLNWLYLYNNQLSDVTPLADLTNLTHLYLSDNPLNFQALNEHIPALQARGVEVLY